MKGWVSLARYQKGKPKCGYFKNESFLKICTAADFMAGMNKADEEFRQNRDEEFREKQKDECAKDLINLQKMLGLPT